MTIKKIYFPNKDLKTTQIAIKSFFQKVGFKVNKSGHGFKVTNGHSKNNVKTLNPLQWSSRIIIEIKKLEEGKLSVTAEFNVNPKPSKLKRKDKKLWEKFIRNFELYLIENKNTIADSKVLLKQKKRTKLKKAELRDRRFAFCYLLYFIFELLMLKFNLSLNTQLILTILPFMIITFFYLKDFNNDMKDKMKR